MLATYVCLYTFKRLTKMLDLYLTLGIILLGVILFVRDYFTIDTTSILIMSLFIVSGVLSPEEGFSGFNHPATLTLGCMFVISAAVFKSGLLESLNEPIVRLAKIHYVMALIVLCSITAILSAFVNDTAVVALMIPIALLVSRSAKIAPSKLMIPISFAALLGGTITLIGTSTNILVSGLAAKAGKVPFGMFEFSLPAICLTAIGLLYLFFIAPFLLPKRENPQEDTLRKEAEVYISQVRIRKSSTEVGKMIGKSRLNTDFSVQILGIMREGINLYDINRETILKENDVLKISTSSENLNKIKQITNDYSFTKDETRILPSDNKKIYEVMIPWGSQLAENSLRKMQFRTFYNASVLAIRHRDETITNHISDVVLKEGDMFLLYASPTEMENLKSKKLIVSLYEYEEKRVNYKKAVPTLFIALGVILAATLGIAPMLTCAMIGALLLVTTSIMKPKEAYDAIEWKVIFMMAGVLSMGHALEKTGGAAYISDFILHALGTLTPHITLSIIFLVTFLSTNILSSKATAALMCPIIIKLADAMHVSERPFLVAVMFACSLTFMTPMSYPTNTMVYAPGHYKFNDYLTVGTPLNIIIWIAASLIIPYFVPFK